MTLPTSGPISAQNVANEFGLSSPILFSTFYGKGGAPGSGPISLADMYGRSNVPIFNPGPGSYSAGTGGFFTITSSTPVSWSYSQNHSPAGSGADISSGATASSITLFPPNQEFFSQSVTYTVSAAGQSWTITITTPGNA